MQTKKILKSRIEFGARKSKNPNLNYILFHFNFDFSHTYFPFCHQLAEINQIGPNTPPFIQSFVTHLSRGSENPEWKSSWKKRNSFKSYLLLYIPKTINPEKSASKISLNQSLMRRDDSLGSGWASKTHLPRSKLFTHRWTKKRTKST